VGQPLGCQSSIGWLLASGQSQATSSDTIAAGDIYNSGANIAAGQSTPTMIAQSSFGLNPNPAPTTTTAPLTVDPIGAPAEETAHMTPSEWYESLTPGQKALAETAIDVVLIVAAGATEVACPICGPILFMVELPVNVSVGALDLAQGTQSIQSNRSGIDQVTK